MSNETDRLVSDAYDELANERTPEALNREVLRLAAKEGRTSYSIARAWMRPAAWAATVGLSLVVVLELTNMPESDMAPLPESVPIDRAAAPDVSDRRQDTVNEDTMLESEARDERQGALAKRSRPYTPEEQTAEKAMLLDDAPAVSMDTAPDEVASQSLDPQRTLETYDPNDLSETMERAREQVGQPSLVPMGVEQKAATAPERSADRVSESQAETAAEQSARTAPRAESFAAGITSLGAESDYLCPVEARQSAEKWLKCIQELEASSPRELIDREYEALRKIYPDFEHPATDK